MIVIARRGASLAFSAAACMLAALLTACCLLDTDATCVDFEDPALGTTYHVGDSFVDSGITMTLEPYKWPDDTWTSGGHARIDGDQNSGGTGQDLNLNNIMVAFDFGTVTELTLRYGEYGGNVNLEVNADHRNAGNLSDLDGATVGSVGVAVAFGPVSGGEGGTVTLTGTINSISIGGQELWIDDVCAK